MILGIQYATIRLTILILSVIAQIYLFIRARQTILSLHRSDQFKSRAIRLVGAIIGILFVLNGYIMFRPITWIDPPLAVQVGFFYIPAVWSLGSVFSALILWLTRVIGWSGQMVVRLYRGINSDNASIPANAGRRHFLQAGVAGLTAVPLILAGYGASSGGKVYDIEKLTLPFGYPLRVVHLTDIHAGIYMTREEMRRYSDQVIALQPDLFVLTGDFISNSISFLPVCLEEMSRVHTRYGTFATLGNHENWHGRPNELNAIFRRYRISLLNNTNKIIQTEQGRFAVAGIDDIRTGHPNLESALRRLNSTIPTILLSHRPEIFPQAATHGIPLTLAGHYHGGQIKLSLPGGDFSLAHFRTPYPEGLFRINTSYLYVSRGIGTTFTPVRLNAPPEVTLLELT